MTEQWRPVLGYEGLYEVSESGLVRGVTRIVQHTQGPMTVRGRMLKQFRAQRPPYWMVGLSRDNTVKTRYVHQLVIEVFVGPRPAGLIACHIDGDLNNNHFSNLYWGTYTDNYLDAVRHGTHRNTSQRLTECSRGHLFTEENSYWYLKNGHRVRWCRECRRIRDRKNYAAKAGAIG